MVLPDEEAPAASRPVETTAFRPAPRKIEGILPLGATDKIEAWLRVGGQKVFNAKAIPWSTPSPGRRFNAQAVRAVPPENSNLRSRMSRNATAIAIYKAHRSFDFEATDHVI